jgi:hypothetical protein
VPHWHPQSFSGPDFPLPTTGVTGQDVVAPSSHPGGMYGGLPLLLEEYPLDEELLPPLLLLLPPEDELDMLDSLKP